MLDTFQRRIRTLRHPWYLTLGTVQRRRPRCSILRSSLSIVLDGTSGKIYFARFPFPVEFKVRRVGCAADSFDHRAPPSRRPSRESAQPSFSAGSRHNHHWSPESLGYASESRVANAESEATATVTEAVQHEQQSPDNGPRFTGRF